MSALFALIPTELYILAYISAPFSQALTERLIMWVHNYTSKMTAFNQCIYSVQPVCRSKFDHFQTHHLGLTNDNVKPDVYIVWLSRSEVSCWPASAYFPCKYDHTQQMDSFELRMDYGWYIRHRAAMCLPSADRCVVTTYRNPKRTSFSQTATYQHVSHQS